MEIGEPPGTYSSCDTRSQDCRCEAPSTALAALLPFVRWLTQTHSLIHTRTNIQALECTSASRGTRYTRSNTSARLLPLYISLSCGSSVHARTPHRLGGGEPTRKMRSCLSRRPLSPPPLPAPLPCAPRTVFPREGRCSMGLCPGQLHTQLQARRRGGRGEGGGGGGVSGGLGMGKGGQGTPPAALLARLPSRKEEKEADASTRTHRGSRRRGLRLCSGQSALACARKGRHTIALPLTPTKEGRNEEECEWGCTSCGSPLNGAANTAPATSARTARQSHTAAASPPLPHPSVHRTGAGDR